MGSPWERALRVGRMPCRGAKSSPPNVAGDSAEFDTGSGSEAAPPGVKGRLGIIPLKRRASGACGRSEEHREPQPERVERLDRRR